MRPALQIILSLALVGTAGCHSIEGKQIVKVLYPSETDDLDFGAGYNSITLDRAGESPLVMDKVTVSGQRKGSKGRIISTYFHIATFESRKDLEERLEKDSDIARSEQAMNKTSLLLSEIAHDNITALDSILVVDMEMITDTVSLIGVVTMDTNATTLLKNNQYEEFVKKYGTHYLRKKIYGGRLILIVKISSETEEKKEEMDEKLEKSAGLLGNDAEFRQKMSEIQKMGATLELFLHTVGGQPFSGGQLTLTNMMDYVSGFPATVHASEQILELDFLGYWRVLGVPSDFSRFIFLNQRNTDSLVKILSDLVEVEEKTKNMMERKQSFQWISGRTWSLLHVIRSEASKYRRRITQEFAEGRIGGYGGLASNYSDVAEELAEELREAIEDEQEYQSKEVMRLKANVGPRYVSGHDWQYYVTAEADVKKGARLYLEDADGSDDISYASPDSCFIKSPDYPNMVLCLGKHYYGVYWKSAYMAYQPYCTWHVTPINDIRKKVLKYGEDFMLINVYWPDYMFSLDETLDWIVAEQITVTAKEKAESRATWHLEKIFA